MKDRLDRTIDYMRMSVTDLCNLRCRYCVPKGMTVPKLPMQEILTYEEFLQVARAAVHDGITKFKVTGGEPLVRPGCVDFIRKLKQIPGVRQVTITTNGVRLSECAGELAAAGIDGVNVSLDTLRPAVFREITGYDLLPQVLEGIRRAATLGLPVKINTVLQKGTNDSEWSSLSEIAREHPVDVRFIEMMPIGFGKKFEPVSNEELLQKLTDQYPDLIKDPAVHGNGPACYVKIPGFQGSIGFISAMHGKFCGSCNRIRLTATGKLKPCLCYGTTVDLKWILREKGEENREKMLEEAIAEAVLKKPQEHCFEDLQKITETHRMTQIGG